MASVESLKLTPGQNEERFVTKTSVKGMYHDVQLLGLSSITTCSSESEKENSIQHAVRYFEERFLYRGNIVRSTTTDTFAWKAGSTLEDLGGHGILAFGSTFQQTTSTTKRES